MSITLAYPSLAMPLALVTLPDVEQLPRSRPIRKRQNAFITDAGTDVVYDFGDAVEVFAMKLGPLSKADADAIAAFFNNSGTNGVNGRAKAWQLQDSDTVIYTVRFAQDVIEPQQSSVSWYNISLTLRVTP